MPKFFITSGHSKNDPGAVSGTSIERDIAIKVVNDAIKILSTQNTNGWEIVLCPHELGALNSARWCNAHSSYHKEDLALELHLNSNSGKPGDGIETLYGFDKLSQTIQNELVNTLGFRDRKIKAFWGYWNSETKMPSCLPEIGFVNNPDEVKKILEVGGLALAKGILKQIGGTFKKGDEVDKEYVKTHIWKYDDDPSVYCDIDSADKFGGDWSHLQVRPRTEKIVIQEKPVEVIKGVEKIVEKPVIQYVDKEKIVIKQPTWGEIVQMIWNKFKNKKIGE